MEHITKIPPGLVSAKIKRDDFQLHHCFRCFLSKFTESILLRFELLLTFFAFTRTLLEATGFPKCSKNYSTTQNSHLPTEC